MKTIEKEILSSRIYLWEKLCGELQTQLGRRITDDEIVTMGFVVSDCFVDLGAGADLLSQIFDVDAKDTGINLQIKLFDRLNRLLERSYREAYIGSFGEGEEATKASRERNYEALEEMRKFTEEFAQRAFEIGETSISFSGVPRFIVPIWILNSAHLIRYAINGI